MDHDKKTIRILAFGPAAEMLKGDSIVAEGLKDLDALKSWLDLHYAGWSELGVRMAVNRKIIQGNTALQDGDEVALLPPFSGG